MAGLEQTGNCEKGQEHIWNGEEGQKHTGNGRSVRRSKQGMVMSVRSIKKMVGVRSMHSTVGVLEW